MGHLTISRINLKSYNTLGIPCIANVCEPETLEEFMEAVQQDGVFILGRGSNIFIACDEYNGLVVSTRKLGGYVVTGDSVVVETGCFMPKLIKEMAAQGLGGMEYLVSVPGTLGGCIYNNAGRGNGYGQTISNHVDYVDVLIDGNRQRWNAAQCQFAHRSSLFQRSKATILGARLNLTRNAPEIIQQKIAERLEFCKNTQDNVYKNAGTVFREGYHYMGELSVGSARISKKTPFWIIIDGPSHHADISGLLELIAQKHREKGLATPALEWQVLSNTS
jgi:UDP-N-acetylmuramate dehydrogenase